LPAHDRRRRQALGGRSSADQRRHLARVRFRPPRDQPRGRGRTDAADAEHSQRTGSDRPLRSRPVDRRRRPPAPSPAGAVRRQHASGPGRLQRGRRLGGQVRRPASLPGDAGLRSKCHADLPSIQPGEQRMSEQIPALPPPAKADGPSARPSKDGDAPPGGFADAPGAAETATNPTPGTRPARTAQAEGTKAEGDSSGLKHPAPRRRLAADAVVELVASTVVDPTPTAAPIQDVPAATNGRRVAAATEETGRPITAAVQPQSPLAPAKETAASTLQPKSDDEAKPPARDGITAPAAPTAKTGGPGVRPSHPHHRLNHTPIKAVKEDVERPLREFARRSTSTGPAVPHRSAPSAAPAAAPTAAPADATATAH